jgi:hypothetical protein
MRKKVALAVTALALALPASAFAVPDFGPGNSQASPNDSNAHCHNPAQTADLPQCK